MPETIAKPTVDRLMHHAHLVLTSGDSIRLTDATSGKGGEASELRAGQIYWPPLGSSSGHGWAVLLAIPGQKPLAIDNQILILWCCADRAPIRPVVLARAEW